jgi:hypothetical protein
MSFDPYHKWLGIAPEEQPPNHYRLLGINLFESDAGVVSNAADQRMAHVRSFQAGRHSDCSQRLLNEIASARVCLLDPKEKAEYDAALRVHLAPASAPARIIPTAVPLSQAVASPPAPSAVPRAVPSKRHDAEESTPSTLPDLVVRDQPVNVVATRPRPGLTFLPLAIAAIVGVLAVIVAFAILLGSGVLGRREVVQEPGDRQSPAVTPGRASPAESGDEQAGEIPPGENPDDPLAATGPAHGEPNPPPTNGSATSSTESTQENGTAPPWEDGEHQTTDGAGNEMPDERTTDTTVTKSVQPDNDSVLSARQRLEAMVANESPKQLIERARARTDNDADSFVILLMAKERAATAGDVGMAVAAMDELDTRFEIDAFDTKMELLTQLTVDENQKLDHRRLAELALSLVDVALQRDRSDLAKDCATAALGAARESGDSRLVREATLAIVKLQKP